jgi:hypothetical protein
MNSQSGAKGVGAQPTLFQRGFVNFGTINGPVTVNNYMTPNEGERCDRLHYIAGVGVGFITYL